MKLPAYRAGFPERKFRSYCAPSCLPAGRDPAYKAGLGGHVPVTLVSNAPAPSAWVND